MSEDRLSKGIADTLVSLVVFVPIIVVILLGVWGYNHFFNKPDYSKPWWSGTEVQGVCTVRSYEPELCTNAFVSSDGEQVTSIRINNETIYGNGECHKAAEGLYKFDRFCRFSGYQGDTWDVMPDTTRYPEFRQN